MSHEYGLFVLVFATVYSFCGYSYGFYAISYGRCAMAYSIYVISSGVSLFYCICLGSPGFPFLLRFFLWNMLFPMVSMVFPVGAPAISDAFYVVS